MKTKPLCYQDVGKEKMEEKRKLSKHKYLLTYRFAEVIYDLTVEFCQNFLGDLSYLSNLRRIPTRRTVEQMTQAARSGKQNIVEAVGQSQTSKKGEIKLLGVALASFEELIADFEDFLRQRHLPMFEKNDARIRMLRKLGIEATRFKSPKLLKLPKDPTEAANLLLTLCHQETYLLDRQIKALKEKFISEGGFTENLFKRRLSHLRNLGHLSNL